MIRPLSKTKLSYFRKFLQKKTREAEGRFLMEGWHLLDEALKSERTIEALIYDPGTRRESHEEAILERASNAAGEVFEATPAALDQLSDSKSSQGVVALVGSVGMSFLELMRQLPETGILRVVALDAVGDPGNCGAIVRACSWFGMDAVLFGKGCAELENGKTVRATMGGLFHLPVATGVDLVPALEDLRDLGVSVVSSEIAGADSLSGYQFPDRAVLVIGSEARGVSAAISERADARLYVPSFGSVESLNAASASAVFLAHWRMAPSI